MKIELIEIINEEFVIGMYIDDASVWGTKIKNDHIDRYPNTAVVSIDGNIERLGTFIADISNPEEGRRLLIEEIKRQLKLPGNRLYLPFAYLPKFNLSEILDSIGFKREIEIYLNLAKAVVVPGDFQFLNFSNETSFIEASFGDNISFSGATFGDKTYFSRTTFGDNTSFSDATFGDNTSFWDATFGDNTSFWDATFGNNTYFNDATFGNNTYFNDATFGDNTSFWDATFGDNTDFSDATFGDNTDFSDATFGDNTEFKSAIFNGQTNLKDSVAKGISFQDAIIRDYLYLGQVTRLDEDKNGNEIVRQMKKLNLTGLKVHGFLYPELDDDFKRELAPCVWANQDKKGKRDLNSIKETFLVLKQAYNKNGRFKEEDLAYVEFKRAERELNRQVSPDDTKNDVRRKKLNHFISQKLFDDIGEYGTNPIKVLQYMGKTLAVFVIIFFVFSLIPGCDLLGGESAVSHKAPRVIICDMNASSNRMPETYISTDKPSRLLNKTKHVFVKCPEEVDPNEYYKLIVCDMNAKDVNKPILFNVNKPPKGSLLLPKFRNAIYHSGVTFLTIGYGDLRPCNGLGILFSIIEGFCGLFLMSYLTIAFSRKVLR
jgi:hypothetical protein